MRFLELKLPKTLIDDVSENELKLYLAIMLYKERKISISQAAKLAGLTLSDFIYELGKHKAVHDERKKRAANRKEPKLSQLLRETCNKQIR